MNTIQENAKDEQQSTVDEEEAIDHALLQMEILYKCRCVQPPLGTNVTIREIKKDEREV